MTQPHAPSDSAVVAVWHEAAREPLLLALAAGTIAAGVALRRPQLARDGARMLASQFVIAAGTVAARRLAGRGADGERHGWITQAVVGRVTEAALAALNGPKLTQIVHRDQSDPV